MHHVINMIGMNREQLIAEIVGIPVGITSLELRGGELSQMTGVELAGVFKRIPAGVRSLNLSRCGLGRLTGAELTAAFSAMPAGLMELELSGNDFGKKIGIELLRVLKAIPASVKSIGLGQNQLDERTGPELAGAFKKISVGVTSLDLSGNNFGKKTPRDLIVALKGIPESVASLNLGWNNSHSRIGVDVEAMLQWIPKNITTLDLSGNELGFELETSLQIIHSGLRLLLESFTINARMIIILKFALIFLIWSIALIVARIVRYYEHPHPLRESKLLGGVLATLLIFYYSCRWFNLFWNGLRTQRELLPRALEKIVEGVTPFNVRDTNRGAHLVRMIKRIPASLATLNLSYNSLGRRTSVELLTAFKEISADVKTLSLCGNGLNHMTGKELAAIFELLRGVKSLNLGHNNLGKKTDIELFIAFRGISSDVTSINLKGNCLNNRTLDELANVLTGIVANEIVLDLSGNGVSKKTAAELLAFFSKLNNLHSVIMDGMTINVNQFLAEHLKEQVKALVSKRIEAVFEQLSPFEINNTRLNKLISELEQRQKDQPIAQLACALLLNNQIKNTNEVEPENKERFIEKRAHDAFSFYMKLGCESDSDITLLARFLMWHIKITTEIPSLKDRLGELDIIPPLKFVPTFSFFKRTPLTARIAREINYAHDESEMAACSNKG